MRTKIAILSVLLAACCGPRPKIVESQPFKQSRFAYLNQFQESDFPQAGQATFEYRFVLLTSFQGAWSFHLKQDAGVCTLTSKVLKHKPNATASTQKTVHLNLDDFKHFQSLIEKSNFQSMGNSDVWGADGDEWVLEGVGPGFSHRTSRWCPTQNAQRRGTAQFIEACKWLVEKSNLTTPLRRSKIEGFY